MNYLEIEIRAWPPGRMDSTAIIAIHTPTGVAAIASGERTRERNQKLAVERVGLLLAESNSAAGWTR